MTDLPLNSVVKMQKKSTDRKKMFFTEEETMKVNAYNSAISELEKWRFDREKLAKTIYEFDVIGHTDTSFEEQTFTTRERYFGRADAILTAMPQILVKEK